MCCAGGNGGEGVTTRPERRTTCTAKSGGQTGSRVAGVRDPRADSPRGPFRLPPLLLQAAAPPTTWPWAVGQLRLFSSTQTPLTSLPPSHPQHPHTCPASRHTTPPHLGAPRRPLSFSSRRSCAPWRTSCWSASRTRRSSSAGLSRQRRAGVGIEVAEDVGFGVWIWIWVS